MGAGASIGRLDIRLSEAHSMALIYVSVRRAGRPDEGPILVFRPRLDYLKAIESQPVENLERLSRECVAMAEKDLFYIEKF